MTIHASKDPKPDPDALDRACENLALRFGDLEVSAPDDLGTVTIAVQDRPRTTWRFTAQDRLIANPRKDDTLMSKFTKAAHDLPRGEWVINSYDFYHPLAPVVFITYHAEVPGRGYEPAKFVVSAFDSRGHEVKTDPDAHWCNNYRKTFMPFMHKGSLKERRATALAEAQAWAGERYGVTEWKRDPWGSWGPVAKVDARVRQIKAAIAARSVEVS